jgi:hypothetical protein
MKMRWENPELFSYLQLEVIFTPAPKIPSHQNDKAQGLNCPDFRSLRMVFGTQVSLVRFVL